MKSRFSIVILVLWALVSCRTQVQVSEVETHQNQKITNEIKEDEELNEIIAPYKKALEEKMNIKIAHTHFDLNKNGNNSSLGNLLADYTWEGAKNWAKKKNIIVDGAIINSGGIRSTIGKGDILVKHIFEVMPFENEIVIVKLKGKDMQGIFDYYVARQKNNPVANFIIEIENNQLKKALVNHQPIDIHKTYYIATSDYLAKGGDGMKFFGKGEIIFTHIKMRDLFIEKFKENQEIVPPKDIRLIF
ncbi:MAG: bifunctional NAD pyrophosphatase/5'-nucleotidase [Flavobacteriales bacterium]|nr:MAG: bifunctional NAD pyrophosphatase/5'-nucleotidase [Flavobacteriales bacterium]